MTARRNKSTAAGGKPSTWVTAGGTRRAEFHRINKIKESASTPNDHKINYQTNHNIDIESKKTSNFKSFLKDIKVSQKKTLILVSSFQENLVLASRNIRNVFIENARSVSVYDLLDSEVILIDKAGVKILSEVLA